jgi:hypothetical protein
MGQDFLYVGGMGMGLSRWRNNTNEKKYLKYFKENL